MRMLIKFGNAKISQNTGIFSLPAGKAGTCAETCKGCYALKGNYMYPNVKQSHALSHRESQKADFVENICYELRRGMPRYFRIHESGDFYSQEYIDKWEQIIIRFPDIKFYTYTKRLTFNFSRIKELSNFNLASSWIEIDGKKVINFGNKKDIDRYYAQLKDRGIDVHICPCGDKSKETICMAECTICAQKGAVPIFYKH